MTKKVTITIPAALHDLFEVPYGKCYNRRDDAIIDAAEAAAIAAFLAGLAAVQYDAIRTEAARLSPSLSDRDAIHRFVHDVALNGDAEDENGVEVALEAVTIVRAADVSREEEVVCDECGTAIPDAPGGGLFNRHHEASCSLYAGDKE